MRKLILILTLVLASAVAVGACAGGNGVEPGQAGAGGPKEPFPPAGNVESIIRLLREAGPGPVTWEEAAEVVATECPDCEAVMTTLHEQMAELLAAGKLGDMAEVVQEILDGKALPTDALVEIIQVVDGGGVKGGEPPPVVGGEKPVSGGELEAILEAIAELGDQGMTWREIEELILAECPDREEVLAQLHEAYKARLNGGTLPEEHATTATALEANEAPPASNTGALLDYVASDGGADAGPAPGDGGGARAGGASSVDEALAKLGGDTTYVRLEYVKDACGGNDACVSEFDTLVASFEAACTSDADCVDEALARLLFGPAPSSTQKQAGICPSSGCVQIRELKRLIEKIEAGIEPLPPFEGDVRDAARKISGEIRESGVERISWDDLPTLVENCDLCVAVLDAVGEEIDRMLAAGEFPEELRGGAAGLREGAEMDAEEAIAIFDVVAGP